VGFDCGDCRLGRAVGGRDDAKIALVVAALALFSRVRACEKNLKRYRSSTMAQRWLASSLLQGEKSFRTVKGHEGIQEVLVNIEKEHQLNAVN
jgi:hypothetical protein